MAFDLQLIGLFVVLIWLLILTIILWVSSLKNKKIYQGLDEPTAAALLQKIAKEHEANKHELSALLERAAQLETGSLSHIQKVGLIRFNPFKDTGGDQSFVLALLDSRDSGIVISGLYSRSGTRWYAKKVEQGKGVDYDLSDEEKKAIDKAK